MMIMNNAHDLKCSSDIPFGQGITLEPFIHQVSGRATMMCLNETTVCKPLNYREHFFYKSLPPDILQFTPQFKGVVNVNIEETPDGTVALTAYPYQADEDFNEFLPGSENSYNSKEESVLLQESCPTSSTQAIVKRTYFHSPCKRIRLKRTGSLCMDEKSDEDQCSDEDCPLSSTISVNPWIFKVHKEGLKRQLKSRNKVVQKCILLENVASQFRRPCILDLKMGTRIHGDHDDDDKKLRHERKCAATTTQKLGVRLSGMQVFNASSSRFLCRDKYFGRELDRLGLRSALHQFFHNGHRTRHELLRPVLKKLRSIRASLKQLRSYRFYASSLLIMYDGDSRNFIDNAAATPPAEPSTTQTNGKANSQVSHKQVSGGLSDKNAEQNVVRKLPVELTVQNSDSSISDDNTLTNGDCFESNETCLGDISSKSSPCRPTRVQLPGNDKESSDVNTKARSKQAAATVVQPDTGSLRVDIRMIDFAKSTHRQMDSSFVHDGPDHGYIFGLTNLITLLKEISQEASNPAIVTCEA